MADINKYVPVSKIIADWLDYSGLPKPAQFIGGNDATTNQVVAIIREIGQMLVKKQWRQLQKLWTITMTPGVTRYDLPADFETVVNNTAWNRTSRLPALGPQTPQQWNMLQARQLGGRTFQLQYRYDGNQIEFYYSPAAPQTIAIQYKSRGWVQKSGGTSTTYIDEPQSDGDVVLFPADLMRMGIEYYWRRKKGFATEVEADDWNKAIRIALAADMPAPDLSLTATSQYPYLGSINIPDTNYGVS